VIQVENVYEEILYQMLLEEALKGENILEVTVINFWLLASELLLQQFPEPSPGCFRPRSRFPEGWWLWCCRVWIQLTKDAWQALKSE